jgi:hypothetical protein
MNNVKKVWITIIKQCTAKYGSYGEKYVELQ